VRSASSSSLLKAPGSTPSAHESGPAYCKSPHTERGPWTLPPHRATCRRRGPDPSATHGSTPSHSRSHAPRSRSRPHSHLPPRPVLCSCSPGLGPGQPASRHGRSLPATPGTTAPPYCAPWHWQKWRRRRRRRRRRACYRWHCCCRCPRSPRAARRRSTSGGTTTLRRCPTSTRGLR
jgi:hypothetical protein